MLHGNAPPSFYLNASVHALLEAMPVLNSTTEAKIHGLHITHFFFCECERLALIILLWGTPESPPPPASPTPLPSTLPNPPPPPPKLAPLLLPPPPNANAPPPLLLPPPPNANAPPPAGAALNVVDEVGAPKAKPALALAELPLNPPKAGAAAAAPPKALPPPNALLPLLAPKAGAGVAPKPAAPKAGVGVAPNTLLPLLAPKAGAGVAPKPAKAGVWVALKPPTAGGAAGCATAVSSPSIIPSAELFTTGPGAVLVVDPNTGGVLVVAPKVKALDPPEAAPVLAPNVNPELAGCVAGTAVAPNANAEFAGAAGAVVAPNANAEFAGAAGAKVAPKAKPDPALPVPAAAPV